MKGIPTARDCAGLSQWLDKRNARWLWGLESRDVARVEAWDVRGQMVLTQVFPGGRGWELWTASPSNSIPETLADTDRRIGIDTTPPLATLVMERARGEARDLCSCCKRCGATVPCDRAVLAWAERMSPESGDATCEGRCYCG